MGYINNKCDTLTTDKRTLRQDVAEFVAWEAVQTCTVASEEERSEETLSGRIVQKLHSYLPISPIILQSAVYSRGHSQESQDSRT